MLKSVLLVTALIGMGCTLNMSGHEPMTAASSKQKMNEKTMPEGAKSIVVAGGCFWCVETIYDQLKGVYWAESGYAGGNRPNPNYEIVMTGITGHAEAVKVVYDPKVIAAEDLYRVFFVVHDPTTLNRQGPDVGTQYRSAIFFANEEEKKVAEKIRDEIVSRKIWKDPIVTTFEPLKNYSRAEEYHQDYFAKYEQASEAERMRMNAGYCAAIIEPKVRKFRKEFLDKLKK
jgi:peptide-methionine (S)-S-oxide reductase